MINDWTSTLHSLLPSSPDGADSSMTPPANATSQADDRTLQVVLLSTYSIVGTVGNLMVVLMLGLNRPTWKTSNLYILCLSVADLLLCATVFPLQVYANIVDTVPVWCGAIGALTQLICTVSVFSVTAIAINRYLLVKLPPATYHYRYSSNRTLVSILLIWLLASLTLIPGFFGNPGYSNHYALCLLSTENSEYMAYAYIYQVCIALVLGVPCSFVIAFSYVKVWKIFHMSVGVIQHFNYRNARSFRLTRNLFILTVVFVVCWLPEFLLECININFSLPPLASRITILLALANSAVNPFLFMFLNKRYLRKYMRVSHCCRKKNGKNGKPRSNIKTITRMTL